MRAKLLGALALVLTTSILGCGPMVRRLGEQAGRFAVGSLVGITADTSELLQRLELTAFQPQRIAIGFNAERYDPQSNLDATLQRPSPNPPLVRAYHIDVHLTASRGYTMTTQMDLPVEASGDRIPVVVTSFPDPKGRLPMAKVEMSTSDGRRLLRWFDYGKGAWRTADAPQLAETVYRAIETAKAKAVELGYNLSSMEVICDDKNSMWNWYLGKSPEGVFRDIRAKLEKHRFWAVYFMPTDRDLLGGDLWVFVDRDTGAILEAIRGE